MGLGNIDLTPQLIQAVRDAVDVVAIASDHTRLRKAGRKFQGLCPLHKEKSPSFSVDPDKGLFYCFGCGAGGDAIRLHMLTSGDDFPSAIEALAARYGIPLPTKAVRRGGSGGTEDADLTRVLEAAHEYFRRQLQSEEAPRRYLAQRRVPPEMIERFELGFAPDGRQHLLKTFQGRIPAAQLEAAGLIATSDRPGGDAYDRFRNRLMFPIRAASGRLLGFGGRTLGEDRAKYLNTRETEQFHKGSLLYGLYEAKRHLRESRRAVLAEGYFDVIACVASGVEGAVASMGTALTADQAKLLSRYGDEVVIAYDGDRAGEAAAERAMPLLLKEGFTVRRALLPAHEDPDSLRLDQGPEMVRRLIAEAPDAVALALDLLAPAGVTRTPKERSEAARLIRDLLEPIPDPIVRAGYARWSAQRLGVPEEALWKREASLPGTVPERSEGVTRRLEEWLLGRLFDSNETILPFDQLPEPEAFFDPIDQRLFVEYLEAYRSEGVPPDANRVRQRLPTAGAEVARLSRILHDGGNGGEIRFGLRELISQLQSRLSRQRRQDLAAQIREAGERGDREQEKQLIAQTAAARRTAADKSG